MTDTKSKLNQPLRWLNVRTMFRNLDAFQDLLVLLLAVVLVIEMVLLLGHLFVSLRVNPDFKIITSDSLFLLILVELFRLLAVYLKNHRIYVGVAVEVTVVSVLREIIVEGIIHMHWTLVFAICAFLLAMGALLFISYKYEPQDTEH